jgi:hypothetical protein
MTKIKINWKCCLSTSSSEKSLEIAKFMSRGFENIVYGSKLILFHKFSPTNCCCPPNRQFGWTDFSEGSESIYTICVECYGSRLKAFRITKLCTSMYTRVDRFWFFYLYFPHMEYEGSIGLVTEKMKFFYCWFSLLNTFYGKKHDLSEKKISVCHAPLPPFAKICTTSTASPLQARKLKFWLP